MPVLGRYDPRGVPSGYNDARLNISSFEQPSSGGVSGFDAFRDAYQQTYDLDTREMDFNSAQAEINRNWQERMDNTKVQRLVKDIQRAGLNPWLALNGGGAVTSGVPSGSYASASTGSQSYSSIYNSQLSAESRLKVAAINAAAKITSSFLGGLFKVF